MKYLIDISSVVNNQGAERSFEVSVPLCDEIELTRFDDEVKVFATFKNMMGAVELEMNVSGRYNTQCARCLEDTCCEFSYTTDEGIDTETDLTPMLQYDIYQLVLDTVFTNLPFVSLCSAECKGICEKCGKNRNIVECECL